MHTIGPEQTGGVSAFATDGGAVYFGSGVADGTTEFAPDLWRVVPGYPNPELAWRNPDRERTIAVIAGDVGTVAFVDMDGTGERDWNLWLLPTPQAEPILLDSHPGDADVSGLVPSVAVSEHRVVWTSFDRGATGPVSQLLAATTPDWSPVVVAERDARVAELWLPALRGTELAYCELRYNADRTHDERHVFLTDLLVPSEPRQLDASGRATMPVFVDGGIIWKETDPGFSMFNWGHLVFWDRSTETLRPIPSRQQPDVNYPSAGSRFVAVYGYDSALFQLYDVDRMRWRLIDRYDVVAGASAYRAVVGGSLLAWLETDPAVEAGSVALLRWAWLPPAGGDRLLSP